MIKLIAVDMDGTLLNSKKELPPDIFQIIRTLKEQGVLFAVASGRQYYNLEKIFAPVKEDILFISENGAAVYERGKAIHLDCLPPERVPELLQSVRDIPDTFPILCGKNAAYYENDNESLFCNTIMYYEKNLRVEDLLEVQDSICKIAAYSLENSEKFCYPYLEKYKEDFIVSISGSHWVDIMKQGVNKGNAIKKLQEKFMIGYDETMVFGDYLNDYEMMQSCYYSYAMANAHPDLIEASRYVAKSNDENGVVETLRHYFSL